MIDTTVIRQWFSKELRRRMNEEEVKPRDMSYYCRVSPNVLGNYLQGKSFPKPWTLAIIADFLCTTTNELLDFDEADDDSLVKYEVLSIFEDEEEFSMHVRNRIEEQMNKSHIGLEELSEMTGFTVHTIKRWLGCNGKQPELPRTSDLLILCDALDCTPSDLLGY